MCMTSPPPQIRNYSDCACVQSRQVITPSTHGQGTNQLQLVGALPVGRRRDHLAALDARAVRVVTDLGGG